MPHLLEVEQVYVPNLSLSNLRRLQSHQKMNLINY
jgi:hypothetical protein